MRLDQQILQAIDRQPWLEQLSQAVQQVVVNLYQAGGQAGIRLRDVLHGTWLGHPLHALLTDVPVGAYTAALALDGLELATGNEAFALGADASVALGVAASLPTAAAGLTDWQHTTDTPRRTGMLHALLNTSALLAYAASLAARKQKNRSLGISLALLGFGLTSAAGYLGGELVYAERIGVDHAPEPESLPKKFTKAIALEDLPESQPHKVEVKEVPVVLVRRGDRVYALAETCAHLGGPLAEGTLDGDAIVCPWHGSTFALEDGALLQGPSVYTQPCFETRVRAGQVEIRLGARA